MKTLYFSILGLVIAGTVSCSKKILDANLVVEPPASSTTQAPIVGAAPVKFGGD